MSCFNIFKGKKVFVYSNSQTGSLKKKKQQPPTQNNPFQKQRKQNKLGRFIKRREFLLHCKTGRLRMQDCVFRVNQFATSLDRGNIERTPLFLHNSLLFLQTVRLKKYSNTPMTVCLHNPIQFDA